MLQSNTLKFYTPQKSPTKRYKRISYYPSGTQSAKTDRFIPTRNFDPGISQFKLSMKEDSPEDCYQKQLQKRLFNGGNLQDHSILNISPKKKLKSYNLNDLYSQNRLNGYKKFKSRKRYISQTPEKILDAPGLIDDYYLNLLDWSNQNILAVALAESVYLWNAESGSIKKLLTTENEENYITSLSWNEEGELLAIGTNDCDVMIYDIEHSKRICTLKGHLARVASLSWNKNLLSSGSRSGKIINFDIRSNESQSILDGHDQEICGLQWSKDGTLLASGGNDNLLNIWENGNFEIPKYSFTQHTAAVKAIAWCPWQSNLLASGGGSADRTIRFWNMSNGTCLKSIDTKSQVCAIQWSKYTKELVSSHGFSENQLIVWKYSNMEKLAELTGHQSRVLHLAMSVDGSTVVSAAGDETLRFWNIFQPPTTQLKKTSFSIGMMHIR